MITMTTTTTTIMMTRSLAGPYAICHTATVNMDIDITDRHPHHGRLYGSEPDRFSSTYRPSTSLTCRPHAFGDLAGHLLCKRITYQLELELCPGYLDLNLTLFAVDSVGRHRSGQHETSLSVVFEGKLSVRT
jgi:hypothetical protein